MIEFIEWVRERFENIRDSLFLLPAGIILVLGVASQFARELDGALQSADDRLWLLSTTVDSARAILSTVATATVTVAAIVFSMTSVVVQLATNQFSPRVTQDFLRNRYQQVTIGITIGTFVYALLVLGSVRETTGDDANDYHFSATLGVVFAVISMLAIVSFIDRVMRSMRVDSIVRTLAEDTQRAFTDLPDRAPFHDAAPDPADRSTVTEVELTRAGWVRSMDLGELLEALPGNTSVRVELRTGDFTTARTSVATVWPEVPEKTASAIAKSITLGQTRTIHADPAYGIRQLVDIALRALSPSLHDPTTAADVVRQMTGPMKALLLRELPGRIVGDDRGNRVYLPRMLTHTDYVHGAFTEIRLNAKDQPYVLRALLETLGALIAEVEKADISGRLSALHQEAAATVRQVRDSDLLDHDKESLLAVAHAAGLDKE